MSARGTLVHVAVPRGLALGGGALWGRTSGALEGHTHWPDCDEGKVNATFKGVPKSRVTTINNILMQYFKKMNFLKSHEEQTSKMF